MFRLVFSVYYNDIILYIYMYNSSIHIYKVCQHTIINWLLKLDYYEIEKLIRSLLINIFAHQFTHVFIKLCTHTHTHPTLILKHIYTQTFILTHTSCVSLHNHSYLISFIFIELNWIILLLDTTIHVKFNKYLRGCESWRSVIRTFYYLVTVILM